MPVRAVRPDELPAVEAMVRALWPGAPERDDFGDEQVLARARNDAVDHAAGLRAHAALGFEPTLRLQFFRRRIR